MAKIVVKFSAAKFLTVPLPNLFKSTAVHFDMESVDCKVLASQGLGEDLLAPSQNETFHNGL